MKKTAKQIKSEIKKVVNDIAMMDKQAFILNARYAKGDFSHDVLIKTLTGMQEYKEKLFAKLIKLNKEYEELGYDAEIVFDEG